MSEGPKILIDIPKPINRRPPAINRENRSKIINNNHLKKCHFLDGKYFIVIDESITRELSLSKFSDSDLFFQQVLSEDHCIIMRQVSGENENE